MDNTKKKRMFGNVVFSFIGLTLLTMIISFIGNAFGWQATMNRINPVTGSLEKTAVAVANLFSGSEFRSILGNGVANFVVFAPLGTFLVALIGIGVAYKSGLLTILFSIIGRHFNKFWITFIFVLLAIISNFAGDMGYVVLMPLAAIFYLVNNRNPLVGLVATFVGVSAGQGVNFVLSNMEYGLTTYTELAARLTDTNFSIGLHNNLFFTIIATISLALLITYVTEKIVIPRIPKFKRDEEIIEEVTIGRKEKRGLCLSTIGSIILILVFLYMLIPNLPSSGLLLDSDGETYIDMLLGSNSYFNSSIVYLISLILIVGGWLYGFGARTIRGREQFSHVLYESINNIGSVLVLIFFASQFVAIFRRSNLGTVITVWLVDLIKSLNFTSIPLVLLVFILLGIANLFMTTSITKWAIVSPIVVPMFMQSNMTPEFAQAVFRISEGATNILTPLFIYFIIFVGLLEMYSQNNRHLSLRDYYRVLWPYSVTIFLLWALTLIIWYVIGLPIGYGVYPTV